MPKNNNKYKVNVLGIFSGQAKAAAGSSLTQLLIITPTLCPCASV